MFSQIMIAIVLGILIGIVTGLVPGIHINLVSVMVLSASVFLAPYFSLLALACFIISMSVTHSFLDPIPSIFLGAPDPSQALGVLPGHRFLIKGEGYNALKLTVIGSLGGMGLSILLFPLFMLLVEHCYQFISEYIGFILLAVVIFMILRDRHKLWALFVFLLSGILGFIVMNIPNFSNPLFPMLSGIFGIATLLMSINSNDEIPEQKQTQKLKLDRKMALKALLSGQFSGFLTAVLPGVGSATAAVISLQITRKLGDKGFMILTGSISTVNFILSLVTLYLLDKARNGAVIVVKELVQAVSLHQVILFLSVALIAGSASIFLALKIAKRFSSLLGKVDYKTLVLSVIFLIILLVLILTGWLGLLVLAVSTAVGLIPAIVKTTRTQAMGCIMLPVMLYFLI